MKYAVINNGYFEINSKVLQRLNSLNEDGIFNVSSEALKFELSEMHNSFNEESLIKNLKNSKFFSKVNDINHREYVKDIINKSIQFIESCLVLSKINDNDKHKMEKYIANITYFTGILVSGLSLATPANPIPGLLLGAIVVSIAITISELYDLERNQFKSGFSKLSETTLFKYIENARNSLTSDKLKDIFRLDVSGKLNILENYNEETIGNEIQLLEFEIVNATLDFIVNMVRIPVYLFYRMRISIDEYLQLLIYLLDDNVKNGNLDGKVKARQEKWLSTFKLLSQKISVDFKRSNADMNKIPKTREYKSVVKDRTVEFSF